MAYKNMDHASIAEDLLAERSGYREEEVLASLRSIAHSMAELNKTLKTLKSLLDERDTA